MSDAQSFSDGSAAYITVGLLLDNEDQTWNEEGLRPDIDAALSVDEQNAYYDYTVDLTRRSARPSTRPRHWPGRTDFYSSKDVHRAHID